MKRGLRFLLLGATVAAITYNFGCNGVVSPDKTSPIPPLTSEARQVETATNSFASDLFLQVASGEEGRNFFISPLSVSMALAMTLNGAAGQTYTDMQKTLGLSGLTNDQINQSYQSLISMFQNLDPGVTFDIANSIWYRNTFDVLGSFIETDSTYFNSAAAALDFNDPQSADIINSWVSSKTNGKIPSVISPPIDPNTMMYLINALYFNGTWKYIFDPSNTRLLPFYLSDGSSENDSMMSVRDTLNYFSDANYQAVELPYGKGDYSMLVLLPTNQASSNLFSAFGNLEVDNILKGLSPRDVQVTLPKFKIEYNTSLKKALTQMGMGIAFTDAADLTKINPAGGLDISDVVHVTYVDVNEKGTEAAAVTVVVVGATSVGPENGPVMFNADHPFLFLIKENRNNTILFMGAVVQPGAKASN